jgi:dTDP-4-dehydrorhamnose reductase
MTIRIVILGAKGQMGQAALKALTNASLGFDVVAFGRELDICDHDLVASKLAGLQPHIVLNAAAFTAVDACETDPERAFATNATAVGALAKVCAQLDVVLIHLSTDYVFGDTTNASLNETVPVGPINVYGQSKADGETAIRAAGGRHVIVRTSWIYGPDTRNFFKTMMDLADQKDQITVVEDEASCPTLAADLAHCLVTICAHVASGHKLKLGTFHVAGAKGLTRLAFAEYIMEARARAGLARAHILATTQADFGAPARRPKDSRLDCAAFLEAYGQQPRPLDLCLPDLIAAW